MAVRSSRFARPAPPRGIKSIIPSAKTNRSVAGRSRLRYQSTATTSTSRQTIANTVNDDNAHWLHAFTQRPSSHRGCHHQHLPGAPQRHLSSQPPEAEQRSESCRAAATPSTIAWPASWARSARAQLESEVLLRRGTLARQDHRQLNAIASMNAAPQVAKPSPQADRTRLSRRSVASSPLGRFEGPSMLSDPCADHGLWGVALPAIG